jgi:hypothetical protein
VQRVSDQFSFYLLESDRDRAAFMDGGKIFLCVASGTLKAVPQLLNSVFLSPAFIVCLPCFP